MLQMNTGSESRFKIKSIRALAKPEVKPVGAVCSLEAGNGSDKPPC